MEISQLVTGLVDPQATAKGQERNRVCGMSREVFVRTFDSGSKIGKCVESVRPAMVAASFAALAQVS